MSNTICILAIETSCDDTSIAITKNEKLLSNVTASSLLQHRQYGGIVPEVAARSHEQNLHSVLNKALVKAKIKLNDITHIAYTSEPGLPGSLHVGKIFAKALAYLLSIPLIPVNHMMGHIFSFAINSKKKISFPFISLVVSGGHTAIYYFNNLHKSQLLNETKDDAAGETLDKIGRALNLKYPGGVSIDEIYESKKTLLKLINHFSPEDNFSFSGLKTHITNLINQTKMQSKKIDRVTIASSSLK
jgi:N6-L-threonylcarbamoyladenine synthase